MKTLRAAAALQELRDQPLWKLLGATKAPTVIASLHTLFTDGDKALAGSVFAERLTREIGQLRDAGYDLPLTAQAYISEWLSQGWLTRRFPAGATEEEYELSADAAGAIRFIVGQLTPRTTATESRLSLVIQQLTRLAEETDVNPSSRIKALRAERDRIDISIAEIERSGVTVIPDDRALERAREVIVLAEELTGDFRNVRNEFDKLNRGLRRSLLENEGSRSDVLEALFAGVDLIGESDAGRTFDAFWRLLTNSEQAATLVEALDAITNRSFARSLKVNERRFLLSLTETLLNEGSGVHDVLQHFARSLKSFVQSREFLEHRRLNALLKQATQAALESKNSVRTNHPIGYSLTLTSSRVRSASQWILYDPTLRVTDSSMQQAEESEFDIETVNELVRQSEIDLRTLREHVRAILDHQSQVSIGAVLQVFPAEQGFGSVVGYVFLGSKHGEITEGTETVAWQGNDSVQRRAKLPAIFFMRERYHELME
jgi:hypothetical protein